MNLNSKAVFFIFILSINVLEATSKPGRVTGSKRARQSVHEEGNVQEHAPASRRARAIQEQTQRSNRASLSFGKVKDPGKFFLTKEVKEHKESYKNEGRDLVLRGGLAYKGGHRNVLVIKNGFRKNYAIGDEITASLATPKPGGSHGEEGFDVQPLKLKVISVQNGVKEASIRARDPKSETNVIVSISERSVSFRLWRGHFVHEGDYTPDEVIRTSFDFDGYLPFTEFPHLRPRNMPSTGSETVTRSMMGDIMVYQDPLTGTLYPIK